MRNTWAFDRTRSLFYVIVYRHIGSPVFFWCQVGLYQMIHYVTQPKMNNFLTYLAEYESEESHRQF